jgi:trimeric autotransporter adhesin
MSRRLLLILGGLILLAGAGVWVYRVQRKAIAPQRHPGSVAFPVGLAEDGKGNLYVAVRKQNRILKISADRAVTVFAGNGARAFTGDGGPATQASLSSPMGVAVDSTGQLLVADTGNNRIRRVDAKDNTITTVAGNGSLWSGRGKLATTTALYEPVSVAVDGDDNIYTGGSGGSPVMRLDAITQEITRVMGADLPGDGLASSPAAGPFWVAAGEDGALFVADPNRNSVAEITGPGNLRTIAGGAVCGFAGDGEPGSGALLCFPESVAVSGNKLFIADTANNRIRSLDLNSGVITTVAGNGQPGYSGDGGLALQASLTGPIGVVANRKGDLFIADTGNDCIRRLDAETGLITTWVTRRQLEAVVTAGTTTELSSRPERSAVEGPAVSSLSGYNRSGGTCCFFPLVGRRSTVPGHRLRPESGR